MRSRGASAFGERQERKVRSRGSERLRRTPKRKVRSRGASAFGERQREKVRSRGASAFGERQREKCDSRSRSERLRRSPKRNSAKNLLGVGASLTQKNKLFIWDFLRENCACNFAPVLSNETQTKNYDF